MLTEFDFHSDPSALIYFRESRLAMGGSLSQLAAQKHQLEQGRIITFVPYGISQEEALDFDGFIVGARASAELLALRATQHLRQPGNYVVMEDIYRKRSYPFVISRTEKMFFHSSEVFAFLSFSDRHRAIEEIANFILQQISPPSLGLFTSLDESQLSLSDGADVDLSILEELARNSVEMFVSTYDDTGYLLWQQSNPLTL